MNQRDSNRAVARATGESVGTIAGLGFVPLTRGAYELDEPDGGERDREPLTVDWDELDASRQVLFPVG